MSLAVELHGVKMQKYNNFKNLQKGIDKTESFCYNIKAMRNGDGALAK